MSNKRTGYKRVANVFSWIGTAWVLGAGIVTLIIQLFDISGFRQMGADKALTASLLFIVGAVIVYAIPQGLYLLGCYLADGFKPDDSKQW
ncbi:hypothetical protein ALT721_800012 [Alteromonas alvinellae]